MAVGVVQTGEETQVTRESIVSVWRDETMDEIEQRDVVVARIGCARKTLD
jgi:hypothetical protein